MKRLFYHLTVHTLYSLSEPLLNVKFWSSYAVEAFLDEAPQLLYHCQILDSETAEGDCVNGTGVLYDAFPNLTTVRVSNCWNWKGRPVSMRTLHYRSASSAQAACPGCYWPRLDHQNRNKRVTNVERFVLTTWGEEDEFDRRIPDSFESITLIFIISSPPGRCAEYLVDLWNSFGELAADAWFSMKPFVVVNVESFASHPEWRKGLAGGSVEEGLRQKAIEIVFKDFKYSDTGDDAFSDTANDSDATGTPSENSTGPIGSDTDEADSASDTDEFYSSSLGSIDPADSNASDEVSGAASQDNTGPAGPDFWHGIPPPGPVSPVHFITMEEYRKLVGDHQFAIDTERYWISVPSSAG